MLEHIHFQNFYSIEFSSDTDSHHYANECLHASRVLFVCVFYIFQLIDIIPVPFVFDILIPFYCEGKLLSSKLKFKGIKMFKWKHFLRRNNVSQKIGVLVWRMRFLSVDCWKYRHRDAKVMENAAFGSNSVFLLLSLSLTGTQTHTLSFSFQCASICVYAAFVW